MARKSIPPHGIDPFSLAVTIWRRFFPGMSAVSIPATFVYMSLLVSMYLLLLVILKGTKGFVIGTNPISRFNVSFIISNNDHINFAYVLSLIFLLLFRYAAQLLLLVLYAR